MATSIEPARHVGRVRRRGATIATATLAAVAVAAMAVPGTASAQQPRINRNASLTIGMNGATATLDPHKTTGATGVPVLFNLYDRLTEFDADGTVKPSVARSWQFTGNVLRLLLRNDVKFNDGSRLTAAAVKASIERAKTVSGSTVAASLATVTSVQVVNDFEVRLNLSGPSADLPAVLAGAAGVIINPRFITSSDLGLNPPRGAGSGPKVLQSFSPSATTVFVRADEDYWNPAANQVRKLTTVVISASQPRMNAFRSGQVDLINIRPDMIPEARGVERSKQGVLTINTNIAVGVNGLLLRNTRAPFDKLKVRQALNAVVNRTEIANILLNGVGVPTQQIWPKGEAGHVPGLESTYPMRGDKERARRLLREAGLGDGFSFTANVVSGAEPYNTIGQALQAQFEEIGVKMRLPPIESSQSNGAWNAGGVTAWSHILVGQADPGQTLTAAFTAGGNLCGRDYASECSSLARRAKDQTRTPAYRSDQYKRFSKLAVDNAMFVPVAFTPAMFLAKSKVLNVKSMGMQFSALMDPRYLAVAR